MSKRKTSKPSIKPINGDVPSVICSEVKAAEDEHLGKDETVAADDSKHLPSDKESETEADVPRVICSEVKATEDEHLGKDETIAANDSKHLPSDKESETEVDLIKTPTSKRDIEVNQKAVRISQEKSSFEKVCGTAGHTEMTTDATPNEEQDAYGFSGQFSIQKIHSPVMRNTGVKSIHMEKFHHIEKQTTYSSDDPNMHLEKESSKSDIDLSKILTSERDIEGSHKAGRISEDKSGF